MEKEPQHSAYKEVDPADDFAFAPEIIHERSHAISTHI
jgi:hypothetical protein